MWYNNPLHAGPRTQSIARLTQEPEVQSSKLSLRPHTFVSPSADSRKAVVSYWRKYVHLVLVNRSQGLSLPRKSAVGLTERPDIVCHAVSNFNDLIRSAMLLHQ